MPIYEYTCQSCKKSFEQLVRSMSNDAAAKVKCPECGSKQTQRSLSVFAVNSAQQSSPAPSCGRCGGAPGSCMS